MTGSSRFIMVVTTQLVPGHYACLLDIYVLIPKRLITTGLTLLYDNHVKKSHNHDILSLCKAQKFKLNIEFELKLTKTKAISLYKLESLSLLIL